MYNGCIVSQSHPPNTKKNIYAVTRRASEMYSENKRLWGSFRLAVGKKGKKLFSKNVKLFLWEPMSEHKFWLGFCVCAQKELYEPCKLTHLFLVATWELLAEHDSERLVEISYGLLLPLSLMLFIELPSWPLLSQPARASVPLCMMEEFIPREQHAEHEFKCY